jgi:Ca2+-binding EF-hand superfamily protein
VGEIPNFLKPINFVKKNYKIPKVQLGRWMCKRYLQNLVHRTILSCSNEKKTIFVVGMSVNNKVRQRLQAALKEQSGGLLGLANLFKTFDLDNSGELSWEEFCAALQKSGLGLSTQDVRTLFLDLDKNGNGEISYTEFIAIMRGELSNNRKAIIKCAFESIDTDCDGIISMTDIGQAFNPRNHPDVRCGRSTVNQLIKTFFDSLATVTDTGMMNLSQFMEYYSNCAAFDDDMKFSETMKGLWNLTSTTPKVPVNSLRTMATNAATGGDPMRQSSLGGVIAQTSEGGVEHSLAQLREQLIARGARGIVGLQRKFRIMDDDGSKSLNLVEFKKGIKECALKLTELQMSQLFSYFDQDRNGSINFDEFITGIRVSTNCCWCRLFDLGLNWLTRVNVSPFSLFSFLYRAS